LATGVPFLPHRRGLDKATDESKIPEFRCHFSLLAEDHFPDMNLNQQSPASRGFFQKASMEKQCRHVRVQIVAREEDAEFVECLECGDIFESSEFKDMTIEDNSSVNES